MSRMFAVILGLGAICASAAVVYKAEYNTLNLDDRPMIVTNVTFDGLATTDELYAAIADISTNAPLPDMDRIISTNNPVFVAAVTNCPVAVDPEDASDLGDYGTYGTIGAVLAALVAGLAAVRRNKADVSDLHYSLGSALTPANGAIQLADRTVNLFAPTSAIDPLAIKLPAQVDATKARDFFLRVDLTDASASLSNVSFKLSDGTTAATIETPDGSYPSFDAGKTTLLYFVEMADNKFLLKSETVEMAS